MRVGFIGFGNMGSAMGIALKRSGYEVYGTNHSGRDLPHGIVRLEDNLALIKEVDVVILAVKPNVYPEVCGEIKDYLREEQIVISIAAGQTINGLMERLGKRKIIMAMPNTPAQVGEGMTLLCPNTCISEEELSQVEALFSTFGKSLIVSEKDFPFLTGVVGCLPAYVFLFMEGAADEAVSLGANRQDAYFAISQAILGAAKLQLETGEHPGALKDKVTSPGGTTIAGIKSLEKTGFRNSIIEALQAVYEKENKMKTQKNSRS